MSAAAEPRQADVQEQPGEIKPLPPVPRLVALGLNHSLCISRTNVSLGDQAARKGRGEPRPTTSYLNVLSWGSAPFNCLGQGVEVKTSEYPRAIPFFAGRKVTQVSCGDYHSAVLVSSGKHPLNPGTVFTFGLGNAGRLGYHIDTNSEVLAQQVGTEDLQEPSWCTQVPQPVGLAIGLRNTVVSLSCGANHTLVTTLDGCMYAWGAGAYGVLGNGTTANRYVPEKVAFPSQQVFVTGCSAGSRHSMALDSDGNVWSWGYGGNGRLGLGSTRNHHSPNVIRIFDCYEVTQISCGDSHSACLDRFGTVYTWGCCRGGKLGLGKILSDVLEPCPVEALKGVHVIQVGGRSAVRCRAARATRWRLPRRGGFTSGGAPWASTSTPTAWSRTWSTRRRRRRRAASRTSTWSPGRTAAPRSTYSATS